jgi:hypothetical protein
MYEHRSINPHREIDTIFNPKHNRNCSWQLAIYPVAEATSPCNIIMILVSHFRKFRDLTQELVEFNGFGIAMQNISPVLLLELRYQRSKTPEYQYYKYKKG